MKTMRWTVDIIPEEDGVGFYVVVPALPGCFSQGATVEQAKRNIQKAIALHLKALKKSGNKAPTEPQDSYRTVIEVAT